jgi:hypothetical protein
MAISRFELSDNLTKSPLSEHLHSNLKTRRSFMKRGNRANGQQFKWIRVYIGSEISDFLVTPSSNFPNRRIAINRAIALQARARAMLSSLSRPPQFPILKDIPADSLPNQGFETTNDEAEWFNFLPPRPVNKL